MQFTSLVLAAAALVGVNAVNLTNTDYSVTAGKSFSIGWAGASGPVTLLLKNGPAANLQTFSTITTGATSSPFVWNVPSTLPSDTYAIEVVDSTNVPNYSISFPLIGGVSGSASASTASSTSGTASSASSSATISATTSASVTSASSTGSSSANSTSTGSSTTATSSSNSTATTTKSSTESKTSTGTSGSKTAVAGASSSSSVPNSGAMSEFASPLALVFLTFAAIFTLN